MHTKLSIGYLEAVRSLGISARRFDNIKINPKGIGCAVMDWTFYFLIETNEAVFCEHFNELFGIIGGGKFLDQLSKVKKKRS